MVERAYESRKWMAISGLLGASAVLLGAFGSHGLRAVVDGALLTTWRTATEYQMFHALATLALSANIERLQRYRWALRLWTLGIVLFSGSLYVLVLSGYRKLGMVTPLGGLSFIAGWVSLVVSSRSSSREPMP